MVGPPMHIDLTEGAIPCRHFKARSIPFRWRESVEQQLREMESKGIVEKSAGGRILNVVPPYGGSTKKNSDEPRITVDLTGLNKFVKRPAYPTHVP